MLLLIFSLIIVVAIGYLAQTTGLCLVRGIVEWKDGNPKYLLAILLSGVFAWVAGLTSYLLNLSIEVNTYQASIWFILGGFIFGLGTAFNHGCGVSTLSKLSRGDIKMLATIVGWLVGWIILAYWQPNITISELPMPSNVTNGVLLVASVITVVWVLKGNNERRTLWFSMMGIGLLAGFLFLYERHWTPSGLLHNLSAAIIHDDKTKWPSIVQYLLFFSLLLGMFIAAWRSNKFKLQLASATQYISHLFAGVLMGIGGSLAMGGNDSQLLLALPTLSPAGIVSVLGILLGIRIGLAVKAS